MEINLVTSNIGKVKEFKIILGDEVKVNHIGQDYRELRSDDPEEIAREALERFSLPGRGQVVRLDRGVRILDVAHNPQGMELFCQSLEELGEGPLVLFSLLKDKDWVEMFTILSSHFEMDRLMFVELPGDDRVLAGQDARSLGVALCTPDMFKRTLLDHEGSVVVCGCFAVVRAALAMLREEERK